MEEKQPEESNSLEGTIQSESQPSSPPQKPASHGVQKIILISFLIVSLGVIAIFTYQNLSTRKQVEKSVAPTLSPTTYLSPTTPATPTETPELTFPTEWTTFPSQSLGFSFEYPTEWGEINEEIIDYGNSDPSGQAYQLFFSLTENIYAHGKSLDYSQGTGGGDFYRGDPDKSKQVTAIVYVPTAKCSSKFLTDELFSGWIDFNLPGEEIGGVRLEVSTVLSESDIETYGNEYKLPNAEDPCIQKVSAEQFFKESEARNLDNESSINIDIFKRILDSSKIE